MVPSGGLYMFFKANTGSCDGYCWRFGLDADVRRLDIVHTKDLVHYRLPPSSRFQVVTPDHSLCFHKRTDYIIDSFLSQSASPCFRALSRTWLLGYSHYVRDSR